jgi:large-conductance mechanosensitive channel
MLNKIHNFLIFLEDNHILATVIATVISTYITALSRSLSDDILLPIIYRDGDGDGQEDIKKYENFVIEIFKIRFKIGHFLIELFKFIVMTFLVYILTNGKLAKKK